MSNPENKTKKSSKWDVRTARPTTIASAMGDLMEIIGVRASDADLVARWDRLMGDEIASIARVVAIKKMSDNRFNVVIRPANPAYTLQLSYMAPEITEKINKYFGRDAVGKISFRK